MKHSLLICLLIAFAFLGAARLEATNKVQEYQSMADPYIRGNSTPVVNQSVWDGMTCTSVTHPPYTGGLAADITWTNETSSTITLQKWKYSYTVVQENGPSITLTEVSSQDYAPNATFQESWFEYESGMAGSGMGAVFMYSPTSIVNFSFSPTTFTYDGSAQGPGVTTTINGSSASGVTYSTSGTATATNVGNYTVTATANGSYSGSGSANWSITKASQTVSVTASPSSGVTTATPVTFTASGGQTGVYTWSVASNTIGVSAPAISSTTANSGAITFPAGSFTVSVHDNGNANYSQSNDAQATLTVNPAAGGGSGKFITISATVSAQGNYRNWFKPATSTKTIPIN